MRSLTLPATLMFALLLAGCGTNPVTGEQELQFISTTQEIQIGENSYHPARQVQGGDYVVDADLVAYVRDVNRRLAEVSDRALPYEIHVLNSSVPNAWAMPGGKMAINRGLLTQLDSEAELAAVLGHEIVHAAARHGAKNQERALLIQGGLIAAQIAAADHEYGNLIAGGAMVGAQLINTRYGRQAELEADRYGMEYMLRAGYNPSAAIDLQQTFVRLSEGRKSSWLDGLFASHPPSGERVARNRETAARLGGAELSYGRERYRRAISGLLQDQEAYDAHEQALKAARNEDYANANKLVDKALRLQPREAKFHGLKGDLALNAERYELASKQYKRAIGLYPQYFAFHLHQGYARRKLGDADGAIAAFERSETLLPTPGAQRALGDYALQRGERSRALQYYTSAARSNSAEGKAALAALTRLELEEQPGKYLNTRLALDDQGRVIIGVFNQSVLPVRNIEVIAAYFNAQGQQVSATETFRVRGTIEAGKNRVITTPWRSGNGLRVQIKRVRLAQ